MSQCGLILAEYNGIRVRLFNSQELLEGTSLALFPINKTTLVRWYKNYVKRDQIKMLMEGLELLFPNLYSSTSLLPAQPLSTTSPINDPHPFSEPPDTMGQAQTQRKVAPLPSYISTETSPLLATLLTSTVSGASTNWHNGQSKLKMVGQCPSKYFQLFCILH